MIRDDIDSYLSVEDYVESKIRSAPDIYDGAVESAQAVVAKQSEVLARLISKLEEKGVLNLSEVGEVVERWNYDLRREEAN